MQIKQFITITYYYYYFYSYYYYYYYYYYWYLNLIMVSKLESGTQVSLTKTPESSTWNLESVARNLESKQDCLGVPYMPGEQ